MNTIFLQQPVSYSGHFLLFVLVFKVTEDLMLMYSSTHGTSIHSFLRFYLIFRILCECKISFSAIEAGHTDTLIA